MTSCMLLNLPECILRSVLFDWCENVGDLVYFDTSVCHSQLRSAVWNQLRSAVVKRCSASRGEPMFRWLFVRGLKITALQFENPWMGLVPTTGNDELLASILEETCEIDYTASEEGQQVFLSCLNSMPQLRKLRLVELPANILSPDLLTRASLCCKSLLSLEIDAKKVEEGTEIGAMDESVRDLICASDELQDLSLTAVPFSDEDAMKISAKLRKVAFHCREDGQIFVRLATILTLLRRCPDLCELSINESITSEHNSAEPISTDELLVEIAEKVPNLVRLNLQTCVPATTWTDLTPILRSCRQLRHLTLTNCVSIDSALFEQILTLPLLSSLILMHNNFLGTFDAKKVPTTRLVGLHLWFFAALTDAILLQLVDVCPNLDILALIACGGISSKGVVELEKQHPQSTGMRAYHFCNGVLKEEVEELANAAGITEHLPYIRDGFI